MQSQVFCGFQKIFEKKQARSFIDYQTGPVFVLDAIEETKTKSVALCVINVASWNLLLGKKCKFNFGSEI